MYPTERIVSLPLTRESYLDTHTHDTHNLLLALLTETKD